MTVKELMDKMELRLAGGEKGLLREIDGVYICDLLSWVMAHANHKNAWITIQTHPNIIAVAALLDLSCIIIPEDAEIDADTISKADEEAIPLLVSKQNGFSICTALYDMMKGK